MKKLENELMSLHTTMKVGGPATVFLRPETEDEFVNLLKEYCERGMDFFVLGGGSNIVVSDSGIKKPVICTLALKSISLEKTEDGAFLDCGCGVSWAQICKTALENKLCGVEDFNGLPGSLGGAIFMNARCFSTQVSDVLDSVRFFNMDSLKVEEYRMKDSDWDYKKSPFGKDSRKIVLGAKLKLKKSTLSESELSELYSKAVSERKEKHHFDAPSAGSVFKNNRNFGMPSGKIVDDCGLKGLKIGGAQVAPWHGNFIINTGKASASDIKALCEKIKADVKSKTGFDLEEEIIFV